MIYQVCYICLNEQDIMKSGYELMSLMLRPIMVTDPIICYHYTSFSPITAS
jgi:hypothetical protein